MAKGSIDINMKYTVLTFMFIGLLLSGIAGSCSSSSTDPIVNILSQVSSNQSEIKAECEVGGGTAIFLASNEIIGPITDGHRIEFGVFGSIGESILKGDANATLTYVNRSQEILIVEITIDISTSNFTMITLTCGSDHVNKSITVTVPIGDPEQNENTTSVLNNNIIATTKSAQSTSKCTSFLSIVFIALTTLPLTT